MRYCTLLALLLATLVLFACSGTPLWGDASGAGKGRQGQGQDRTHALSGIASTSDAPNIVYVFTDDQDAASLEHMPNVQALLKAQGTSYPNFTYSLPWCCPSRATMLTGRYAHNTGIYTNHGPDGGYPGFKANGNQTQTVARWLDSAGYKTALFGKYLNDYDSLQVPGGWDRWFAGTGRDVWPNCYSSDGYEKCYQGHPDAVVAEKAEAYLKNNLPGGPLFAWVSFSAPHSPSRYPEQDAGLFADATVPRTPAFGVYPFGSPAFWAGAAPLPGQSPPAVPDDDAYRERLRSLQTVDRSVGRMVEALASSGELDNTYFVFGTDNGWHPGGYHGLPEGKETPFVEDLTFPLIVRGPGVPTGIDRSLVMNTDLAPTFAAMAGASAPTTDGRPMLPLWQIGAPWRQYGYIEALASPRMGNPAYEGVRTEDRLYVEYETGERELYDLEADPYQLQNIAGSEAGPDEEAALAARLDALRDCAGESCRAAENP